CEGPMLIRSESEASASAAADAPPETRAPEQRAFGLVAASIYPRTGDHPALTFVADLDESAIARVRREALALRLRHRVPVTIELRYVHDRAAAALVATLDDLAHHQIELVRIPVGAPAPRVADTPPPLTDASTATPAFERAPEPDLGPDPFGLDLAFRA